MKTNNIIKFIALIAVCVLITISLLKLGYWITLYLFTMTCILTIFVAVVIDNKEYFFLRYETKSKNISNSFDEYMVMCNELNKYLDDEIRRAKKRRIK